jgi:DNA-directed RNA polymerase delta subunit
MKTGSGNESQRRQWKLRQVLKAKASTEATQAMKAKASESQGKRKPRQAKAKASESQGKRKPRQAKAKASESQGRCRV